MESLIFLDIDGVINSTDNIHNQHAMGKSTLAGDIEIPKNMLLRVKRIVDETNSYLVISSTWRKFSDAFTNLEQQFAKVGVKIYGTTPNLNKDRGFEILDYLRRHNFLGCPFMVIDDDSFDIKKYIDAECFIHTSGYIGLTDDQVETAIASLNKQRSILLGNLTHTKIDHYKTKEEASDAYSVYINSHINAVKFIFQKYVYTIISYMADKYPDETAEWDKAFQFLKEKINDHDKSKFSDNEFEGYRAHYYKSDEDSKDSNTEEAYNKAWEHHYKHNSHHPEFWVINIGDSVNKRRFIEMNKSSIIEMLCDWIAMSYIYKQSLYTWWFETKSGREEKKDLMASNTLKLIDDFVIDGKDIFDFSIK